MGAVPGDGFDRVFRGRVTRCIIVLDFFIVIVNATVRKRIGREEEEEEEEVEKEEKEEEVEVEKKKKRKK